MHIRKEEEEEEEASRALFVYSPPSTSIRSMTLSLFLHLLLHANSSSHQSVYNTQTT